MTKLPKTFLTIFIVGLAISLTGPGAEFAGGIIKPLSVVCFILFYLTNLLGNEMIKYDEDQDAKLAASGQRLGASSNPAAQGRSGRSAGHTPSLAGAGSK